MIVYSNVKSESLERGLSDDVLKSKVYFRPVFDKQITAELTFALLSACSEIPELAASDMMAMFCNINIQ